MDIDLREKKPFAQRVYEIVRQIPPGYVMTYGQIALLIGHPRAARQVGGAMRNAPEEKSLPCHRVVNRLGEMAPDYAFGSKEYQRMLLENEGAVILPNGNVDVAKCLYMPKQTK